MGLTYVGDVVWGTECVEDGTNGSVRINGARWDGVKMMLVWWFVVRERALTMVRWVGEESYGGGWDGSVRINGTRLKLWLCGWVLIGVNADEFGVKNAEVLMRGRDQTLHRYVTPGGPISVFKIITILPLRNVVCCFKRGRRWFQKHHFKNRIFNNVFQTTLNTDTWPNAYFYFWTPVFSV